MQSFAETWLEEGREEGRRQALEAIALRLIHRRFGIMETETTDRIRLLPLEKLEQFIEELLNFTSRDDLTAWLLEQAPDET
jgi:hypothetical protein